MLEVIIVAGLSWIVGDWLISKKHTPSFLIVAFVLVFLFGTISGFLFGAFTSVAAGDPNSFGVAVIGAMRGAFFGLIFGGWSIVRSYRSIAKAKTVQNKGKY